MRYRADALHAVTSSGEAPPLTEDFVALTVLIAFFIGVLFTLAGMRGRQRWLVFWGALTVVACVGYGVYSLR